MKHLDSHYREEDVENEVSNKNLLHRDGLTPDLAFHSELDNTAKRRKMAIELGDMTKLQWFD